MQDTIVMIYCVCDDFLQGLNFRDDPQCHWSSAEVMTAAVVAATYFHGNLDLCRRFLLEAGYFTQPLSKSRLNRRLHAVPAFLWQGVFGWLSQVFQHRNRRRTRTYLIDSMPLAVCQHARIHHCRLFPFERWASLLGYAPSKKRHFYGLRLHLLTTSAGEPVEFVLSDGSCADVKVFKQLNLDLETGSVILADKAYNDYKEEDQLQEIAGITLKPQRKKNLHRQWAPWQAADLTRQRQRIEGAFARIAEFLPRRIPAVTPQGFILKLNIFVLALSFHCLVR